MAVVRYPIKLNVKPSPYPLIKSIALVQGDTANVFAIELQEDKQPFNIEDCYVTATFKKADDNVVILEGEIIDATNGLVDIPIYLQAVSCVGKTYCTIEVYNNNDLRLTSIMFEFDVVEQLGHGEDIESVTEYTILQELIADVQSIKVEEEQRVINENTRIQNEIDRQTVFDGIVNTANTTKDGLDASIIDANNVKSLLDHSITSGNDIKTNLDTSIDNAKPILSDLNTSIDEGNQLKIDLPPLVDNADTSKTNLDTTITNANIKKAELDGSISTATTKQTELDTSISTAETTKINLDNSISSANTINDTLSNTTTGTIKKATDINNTLGTTINSANTSKSNLDESIIQSTTSKTNLDSSITNADAKKVELDSSISTANTTKTELDTSITNANIINDTLSNATTGTIKQATDINTALNSSIDIANTSKGDLDTSIDNSTTAKTNLDDSISTANVTKTALDDSIIEGNDLKGDLEQIISGTDFEQVISDISNLKQDQHNHTNKDTLDGLSDVDGKLKYNGQDVGIGDMTKAEFDVDGDGIVDKANDSNKLGGQLPSYYAQKTYVDTELNKKISTTEKGNANGLAELDSGGKVPASQLPSYVDDVLEFSSLSAFPTTGETGKIYVATNTNLTYRWSGTGYVEISPSIALGETPSTAYRGDRGKIAYDHSQSTHARVDATKVENSTTNGNIKINGTETNVYTHPANHDDRYYTEAEIDIKLSDKVDNSRVLTDVPANAKFTDTIISINDTLTSTSTTQALSANQGKVLDDKIDNLTTDLVAHKADYAKEATMFVIESDDIYTRTNCVYYKKNGWVKLLYRVSRVDEGLTQRGENIILLPAGFRPKTNFVTLAVQCDVGILPPFEKMTLRVYGTGELQVQENATKKIIHGEVVFYAGGGTV